MGSLKIAVTVVLAGTVCPFAGNVVATVGGVASMIPLTATVAGGRSVGGAPARFTVAVLTPLGAVPTKFTVKLQVPAAGMGAAQVPGAIVKSAAFGPVRVM